MRQTYYQRKRRRILKQNCLFVLYLILSLGITLPLAFAIGLEMSGFHL